MDWKIEFLDLCRWCGPDVFMGKPTEKKKLSLLLKLQVQTIDRKIKIAYVSVSTGF